MAHTHPVYDTDVRFMIDPYSRGMKDSTPADKTIIRGDHNSEVYTFGIPRFIEGHDMLLCDQVEVRFVNGPADGFLPIVDLQECPDDEELLVFSWKVTKISTQNVAPLAFSIYFACHDETGEETYKWETAPFSRINVKANLGNNETIDLLKEQIEEYIETNNYIKIETGTTLLVTEDDATLIDSDGSILVSE